MRRWILHAVLFAGLLLPVGIILAGEEAGTATRVVDGNTIVVAIDGREERVRLIGVDTPETIDPRKPVEAFGRDTSAFTKRLVEGKRVILRDELGDPDRDNYGRLLRYVYLEDGTFVNAEIIKQGYGHAYVKYPFSRMEEFRSYERQAREKGLGLWRITDTKAEPGPARAPTQNQYVGSSKSNKYHRPDCISAQKISPANLITFASPEEGQSRGYDPCKVCNPPVASGEGQLGQVNSLAPATTTASEQGEEIVYVPRTGTRSSSSTADRAASSTSATPAISTDHGTGSPAASRAGPSQSAPEQKTSVLQAAWRELQENPIVAGFAIIGGIIAFLTLIYMLLERRARQRKEFPYDALKPDELYGRLGVPRGQLEDHVSRRQLTDLWGPAHMPHSPWVLLHGRQGVGKTREAIETIRVLTRGGRHRVFYCQGTAPRPPAFPPTFPARDVVLFLDDLRVISEGTEERDESHRATGGTLLEVLESFSEKADRLTVFVTLQTQQFRRLDATSPETVRRFEVIALEQLDPTEKEDFIRRLAAKIELPVAEEAVHQIAEAASENLADLHSFLEAEAETGHPLDAASVERFRKFLKEGWRHTVFVHLRREEQELFKIISQLRQFNLPTQRTLVKRLFFSSAAWLPQWRRSFQFNRALARLRDRWLTIDAGTIYCHQSRLQLRQASDPTVRDDLQSLSDTVLRMTCSRRFRRLPLSPSQSSDLLGTLARRLLSYRLADRALELAKRVRELAPEDPHTFGLLAKCYQAGGRADLAIPCLRDGLRVSPDNAFLKHALASILWKQHNYTLAAELLEEVIAADPNDLLARTTLLEVLAESGPHRPETIRAYKELVRALRSPPGDPLLAGSARLIAARFPPTFGGDGPKLDRRMNRACRKLRELADSIPFNRFADPKALRFRAVVLNVLGCLLYDDLALPDEAIVELRRAYEAWPGRHTVNKLAAIYYEQAELNPRERHRNLEEAARILGSGPEDPTGRLEFARIKSRGIDWANVPKAQFWEQADEFIQLFRKALRADQEDSSLHNRVVHHQIGCFLWHLEYVSHRRSLVRPSGFPTAEEELERAASDSPSGDDSEALARHYAIAYATLAGYLLSSRIAHGPERARAKDLIDRSFAIASAQGTRIHSANSFVLSHLGCLLLEQGNLQEAEAYLRRAIDRYDRNPSAWWLMGRVYELRGEYPQALQAFEKSALIQRSARLFGEVRGIRRELSKKGLKKSISEELRLSRQAYDLDPEGQHSPKNLSDFGFDLYQMGRHHAGQDQQRALREAYQVLVRAADAYTAAARDADPSSAARLIYESNFPLWFAGECLYALDGHYSDESLWLLERSAKIQNKPDTTERLCRKLILAARIDRLVGLLEADLHPAIVTRHLVDAVRRALRTHLPRLDADLVRRIRSASKRHPGLQLILRAYPSEQSDTV